MEKAAGGGPSHTDLEKNSNSSNASTISSKLIARLDIDIGPNEKRTLYFFKNQAPLIVAREFCADNNLAEGAIKPIANTLAKYLR